MKKNNLLSSIENAVLNYSRNQLGSESNLKQSFTASSGQLSLFSDKLENSIKASVKNKKKSEKKTFQQQLTFEFFDVLTNKKIS